MIVRESDGIAKYEHCSYCGSPLNYAFYFCTVCATPYRPVSEVIPPVAPRVFTEGELIRKKVPNVWRVFWAYAVVIFVVLLVGSTLFEGEQQEFYTLIFGGVCISLTTIAFEVIFWRSLVVQLRQFGFFEVEAWVGLLLLAVLLLVNFGYHWLLIYWEQVSPSEMWLYEADLSHTTMFVLLCLIPGITEEIAFRGLIQHWLHTVLKPWRAIVLTSFLFMALHLSVLSAPYIFLLGILLGWAKWKCKSLYPSMVMHIVHNWAAITVFPMVMK
ncbi:MAG: lysostaphin resistance A-like protein [Planctomycetota bacterium]|jgi:membrane protease YdiL (CAAX protease family)